MKKRNLLKQLMLTLSFFLLGGVSAWADIDFGNEAVVSTKKTWKFGDLETSTQFSTYTEIDGLYLRTVASGRSFTVKENAVTPTTLTFSDAFSDDVTKYLYINNNATYNSGSDLQATSTAGDGTSKGAGMIAINASVAGTFYVKIKGNADNTKKIRLYFANGNTITNTSLDHDGTIQEITYTSTEPGAFFVGGITTTTSEIYEARFVPSDIPITATTNWVADDLAIMTFSQRKIVNLANGLFVRAKDRDMSIAEQSECTTWTFADGHTIPSISKCFVLGNLSGTNAGTTPYEDNTNMAGSLAFKVAVPGKLSVVMSNTSNNVRIYNTVGDTNNQKLNVSIANTPTEYSAYVEPGIVYISATAADAKVYAIRFVPETVTTPTIRNNNGTITITPGVSSIDATVKTCYTTDGSDPNATSTEYTAPFSQTSVATIKAISISQSSGAAASEISTKAVPAIPIALTANSVSFAGLTSDDVKMDDADNYNTETAGTYQTTSASPSAIYVKNVRFCYSKNGTSYQLGNNYLHCQSTDVSLTIPSLTADDYVVAKVTSVSSGAATISCTSGGSVVSGSETSKGASAIENASNLVVKSTGGNMVLTNNAGAGIRIFRLAIANKLTVAVANEQTSMGTATITSPVVPATVTVNDAALGDGYYVKGSSVTVTATPNEGYYFVNWTNASSQVVSTNAAYTFNLNEDLTITANFAAKTDLSTAAISLDHDSFVYDCTEKSPSVTGVTLNETPLTLNDDYIVNAITAQTNAGNAYEVTITGAGHYKGTATKTWSITPATISAVAITEITAPEKGVALDTEATCATTGITSTSAVIWKIGDTEKTGDAEANKAYTAYVTLTADGNHQFIADPLATGTINSETATVSRTDANNIVVSYTFPATALISINPTISLTGWTYGEAANTTPTVEGNTGDGAVTYQYKLTTANDDAYATFDADHYPTAAGEYNIKANIAANGDYAAGSAVNTFTIAKAALSSLSVSITGWAWGEYNLTTNAPQVSGNTGNGTETIEYKGQTAEDYTYVTQIPIDAGNYTVRVSVAETDNYQAGSATANFTVVTATNYSVTLPAASNGNSITATKTSNAHVGDEITLTINTNDNYTLKSIYGDHSIELSTVQNQPTKRKFTMPAADVTITATWEEKTEGNAKTQITEEVKIEGDNAEITKVDMAETTTTVTISSSVGGKTVTSIDAAAFSGLTNDQKANLQTVDLSSTGIVLTMARDAGDSPFRDLDANTLVYLPEGSSMAGQNVIIKDGANYSCTQFVMTDAKSYDIPHAFSATSAFLVRDFTNGQTCTVCLPFSVPAVNIPGKIYRYTSISGNQVTMTEDTDGLDANVPYILVPNGNDNIHRSGGGITVQITGATTVNDNFTFKGIYEDHTFTAEEISKGVYGFAGNNAVGATPGHFAKAATGAYIKGMRAYLEYTGGSTDPGLNGADIPSGARGESANELPEILNVVLVNADGSTTSIGKLELVDVDDDSTPRYNLSGQRVDKSYKGIVIINGKKVIIK